MRLHEPTIMWLLIEDDTVKKPIGISFDVLVKVENFIFLTNFVVLDCRVDFKIPIIIGRPFLSTGRELVDM